MKAKTRKTSSFVGMTGILDVDTSKGGRYVRMVCGFNFETGSTKIVVGWKVGDKYESKAFANFSRAAAKFRKISDEIKGRAE